MNIPLVSILMTAYNREIYIAEAIDSVLASTYKNFELIIVDDCSTDKTVEIIKEYEKKDERIKFFQNEINLKDYPNRNKAASYAKGVYLMHVDSDDKILKDTIAYCVSEMLENIQADFGIAIDDENLFNKSLTGHEAIEFHFFTKPFLTIGPGSTIIKREFFEKIRMFPTKYGPANDMYFNLKAVANCKIFIFDRALIFYRIHEGQEKNNKFSYLYNGYNYLRDALNELPLNLTPKQISVLSKKNKRRFTVNVLKYFFTGFNIKKTITAIKLAKFSLKDALEGIFHL